ncbi:hypothetical protein QC762_0027900 [Podospora pseudocomata]|uniref:Uncharacterized protein n=1 Tax=Podospora pseudocomata TaxID=2093779 RepID=A0ABR0GRN1_9PEZI|nr:hypothetical protein QC762_0027900 [Podospora pseudocomata]
MSGGHDSFGSIETLGVHENSSYNSLTRRSIVSVILTIILHFVINSNSPPTSIRCGLPSPSSFPPHAAPHHIM